MMTMIVRALVLMMKSARRNLSPPRRNIHLLRPIIGSHMTNLVVVLIFIVNFTMVGLVDRLVEVWSLTVYKEILVFLDGNFFPVTVWKEYNFYFIYILNWYDDVTSYNNAGYLLFWCMIQLYILSSCCLFVDLYNACLVNIYLWYDVVTVWTHSLFSELIKLVWKNLYAVFEIWTPWYVGSLLHYINLPHQIFWFSFIYLFLQFV